MSYYIVGLGNPGLKYETTRHNVAWIILKELFSYGWEDDKYLKAQCFLDNQQHYILPQTFMNKSGESISGLKKIYSSFNHDSLIVIYDDIDLALGTIRISYDRGSGGHNGIKSIVEHLGSQKFIRIRIGVGKVLDDGMFVKPPVLGSFEKNELNTVHDLVPKVKERLEYIFDHGYIQAMNKYNTKS